jgi:hypothetical protein
MKVVGRTMVGEAVLLGGNLVDETLVNRAVDTATNLTIRGPRPYEEDSAA